MSDTWDIISEYPDTLEDFEDWCRLKSIKETVVIQLEPNLKQIMWRAYNRENKGFKLTKKQTNLLRLMRCFKQ